MGSIADQRFFPEGKNRSAYLIILYLRISMKIIHLFIFNFHFSITIGLLIAIRFSILSPPTLVLVAPLTVCTNDARQICFLSHFHYYGLLTCFTVHSFSLSIFRVKKWQVLLLDPWKYPKIKSDKIGGQPQKSNVPRGCPEGMGRTIWPAHKSFSKICL